MHTTYLALKLKKLPKFIIREVMCYSNADDILLNAETRTTLYIHENFVHSDAKPCFLAMAIMRRNLELATFYFEEIGGLFKTHNYLIIKYDFIEFFKQLGNIKYRDNYFIPVNTQIFKYVCTTNLDYLLNVERQNSEYYAAILKEVPGEYATVMCKIYNLDFCKKLYDPNADNEEFIKKSIRMHRTYVIEKLIFKKGISEENANKVFVGIAGSKLYNILKYILTKKIKIHQTNKKFSDFSDHDVILAYYLATGANVEDHFILDPIEHAILNNLPFNIKEATVTKYLAWAYRVNNIELFKKLSKHIHMNNIYFLFESDNEEFIKIGCDLALER